MSNEKPVAIPSRETISSMQVANLLNTFSVLSSFLLHSRYRPDDEVVPGGALDGGVKCAIESTLINLCSRLDFVIAEPGRFDMADQHNLENYLAEAYKQNARMLSAQADAYAEITTPHYRLKPSLIKMAEGSWLAICGDLQNLDNALVGMGDCPQKAIEAFDAIFKGAVPEHLKAFLAARESDPTIEYNTYTQTKNEKNSNTSSVDRATNSNPGDDEGKRRTTRKHRKHPGTDPEISGNQGE
jgi:hypothetical protein